MGAKTVHTPGREAWAIANRDHNIISRAELVDLGFGSKAIRHRLKTGRLHRQARGVYSVGTPRITKHGRWMVAVKLCGAGAALSHLTAAVLWALWRWEPGQMHVTVPRSRNPRADDSVVVHRSDVEFTTHHGIPVTTVLQTLIDCSTIVDDRKLERMINEADALDLLGADVLRAKVEGRPEAHRIRTILERDAFVLTDSELEALLVPLAHAAGLPRLESQVWVDGNRVDFYCRDLNLVIECQSLRYHRTPFKQRQDAMRQQRHAAAGTPCVPFTHFQIAHEPEYVVATLARVAARLRG
jgi:very-short-patch-repair endonuclease